MDIFAEGELGEQQKRQQAAKNQALISLSDRVIGKDPIDGSLSGPKTAGDTHYGRVKIWSLKQKQYVEMWPIDAAEAIASGGCILDKPEE